MKMVMWVWRMMRGWRNENKVKKMMKWNLKVEPLFEDSVKRFLEVLSVYFEVVSWPLVIYVMLSCWLDSPFDSFHNSYIMCFTTFYKVKRIILLITFVDNYFFLLLLFQWYLSFYLWIKKLSHNNMT
jgi:hypothetical protein